MDTVQPLLSVKEHMRINFVTQDGETTITEAAKNMRDHKTDSLLVTNAEEVVGIITETDIVYKIVANKENPDKYKVRDLKSTDLIQIDSTKSIFEAKKIMKEKKVNHLIIKENDKVVGIITSHDLLK